MAGISTKSSSTSSNSISGAQPKRIAVAEIVKMGQKLICPEGMTHLEAAEAFMRKHEEDEQKTDFTELITNAIPPDGAVALLRVLERTHGVVSSTPGEGFFGAEPPQMKSVDIGPNESLQVPWGRFKVPNVDGYIETGAQNHDGSLVFAIHAVVKKKHQEQIKKLANDVREEVRRNSIYKGKAIRVRFYDDEGNLLQIPKMSFMDLSGVRQADLVFPAHIMRKIQANLFGMIETDKARLYDSCRVSKRFTTLLAGDPGLGKTMLANVLAQIAVKNGRTFFYSENPIEYTEVMRQAAKFDEAMTFFEDIDRIMPRDRNSGLDRILNVMDGIDTKSSHVITVLTSNHPENIPKVARRTGRIDLTLIIPYPDAAAAEQMIRNYAAEFLKPGEDVSEAGKILAGQKPSDIFAAVDRSKKYAAYFSPIGTSHITLTAETLRDGALEIVEEAASLNGGPKEPKKMMVALRLEGLDETKVTEQ